MYKWNDTLAKQKVLDLYCLLLLKPFRGYRFLSMLKVGAFRKGKRIKIMKNGTYKDETN
jgi:hypothetical protein